MNNFADIQQQKFEAKHQLEFIENLDHPSPVRTRIPAGQDVIICGIVVLSRKAKLYTLDIVMYDCGGITIYSFESTITFLPKV